MSESRDLQRTLTRAIEVATHNYLVEHAGEDLPDDLLVLDDYKFEVRKVGNLTFRVHAMNRSDNAWRFRFKVSISEVKKDERLAP